MKLCLEFTPQIICGNSRGNEGTRGRRQAMLTQGVNKDYLKFTMIKVFKTKYTYAKRKLRNTTGYLETCLYLMA